MNSLQSASITTQCSGAMHIEALRFTNHVVENRTSTFTVVFDEAIDICLMYQIYAVGSADPVDQFWTGVASICMRSEDLFDIPFEDSLLIFFPMESGVLISNVERFVGLEGEYLVKTNAYTDIGGVVLYEQNLTVIPLPCNNPTVTTRRGPGGDIDNPMVFKRSEVIFIGREMVITNSSTVKIKYSLLTWLYCFMYSSFV